MQNSFLRFFLIAASLAFVAVSLPSCKSGPKDADIEKSISEKAAATPDAVGVTASVKDGVVTLNGTFKDDASKMAFESEVKAMEGVKSVMDNATVTPPQPAPAVVTVTPEDALTTAVKDATKSFPGVIAQVKEGVVTLTGEIKKSDLTTLMMALNTLKPKKIENKLSVQ